MEKLVEQFVELLNTLKGIKSPLLVTHPKADADALGSVCSFAEILKNEFNLESKIYIPDKPGEVFEALFPLNKIETEFKIEDHDSIIFLDRGNVYYDFKFNEKINKLGKEIRLINIDHHPQSTITDALNLTDTKASSTCEIIYRFMNYFNMSINPRVAQYLLNGIYADTGGFRHNNTSSLTLEISSDLLKKGASITKINRGLFSNKSLSTLKLWAIALERAQINPKTGMATSFITNKDLEKCGATIDDASGVSEILNSISEAKFSLVLLERDDNKIKASLRSEEYKGVDVSKIARQFKGGGHKLASGFEIEGKLRKNKDGWAIE
jgi:phosphoesterase RecJ-like protein